MNIQEAEEFKTTKFFCKTDFDMREIKKEEAGYVPLPKFYTFPSREERERILYKNFVQVGQDVKEMIKDVLNKRGRNETCKNDNGRRAAPVRSGGPVRAGKARRRNTIRRSVPVPASSAGEGHPMHEIP